MTKHYTASVYLNARQRRNSGYQFDPHAREWAFTCGACGTDLFAPTLRELRRHHLIHAHKYCLGGW